MQNKSQIKKNTIQTPMLVGMKYNRQTTEKKAKEILNL